MIKIYRQYPIINGFVQVPPNLEANKTKYVVGNHLHNPVGIEYDAPSIDLNSIKDVKIRHNSEYLEFLAVTVGS